MSGKFEVYKDNVGEFRFRLVSAAGNNIMASESYKEKRSAFNGIASIKKNCQLSERFVRRQTKDGKLYFVLKAGNHEIIGKSGNFQTDDACEAGIVEFRNVALAAEIDDLTKKRKSPPGAGQQLAS